MGREYIAGNLRRIAAGGARLTAEPEVLAEMIARLVLSMSLNPEGVLPLDDPEQMASIARASLVPMVLAA